MKGFQEKRRETQNLEQIYKKLEQDWHAMKQNSNSLKKSLSSYNHYSSDLTEEQGYEYVSNFSRKITCELQGEDKKDYCNFDPIIVSRDNDIEAREAIHERVEAIESGKLKCNVPLFNPKEDDVEIFEDINSSPCCIDEIRSNFCDYDDNEYEKCCPNNCCALNGGCNCSCDPSSVSSSSSYNADVDNEEAARAVVDMVARVLEMRLATAQPLPPPVRRRFQRLRWHRFSPPCCLRPSVLLWSSSSPLLQ
ncbi:hypothetical protein HN51_020707 [Arachis hypogaea]